jgi:hypothetical protein
MQRDEAFYRQGKEAYDNGVPADCGPYSDIDWDYRTEAETLALRSWREGWFDAKDELEEELERYTETAPDTFDPTFGL